MKVTIVGGGGGIGSSVAYNLLLAPGAVEVVLLDRRPNMVTSHVLDLLDLCGLGTAGTVRGGTDDDLADADVVVLSAAVPLRLNTSRMTYLAENARIVAGVADRLAAAGAAWTGTLLVITNPVDPLCTWLRHRLGPDRGRLLGYTVNDSLRLRTGLGQALGVAASRVDAWVLGEHGEHAVPLFDRVRLDGAPVAITGEQAAAAENYWRTWYVRHVALDSGRTSTWATGLGAARMVAALGTASGELWPASVLLTGEYGITGVSLSVPVTLAAGGARDVHDWALTDDQRKRLTLAADHIRAATTDLESLIS
ncbi:MAG: malate dehydrogenase [Mycobacteriales bacterium]